MLPQLQTPEKQPPVEELHVPRLAQIGTVPGGTRPHRSFDQHGRFLSPTCHYTIPPLQQNLYTKHNQQQQHRTKVVRIFYPTSAETIEVVPTSNGDGAKHARRPLPILPKLSETCETETNIPSFPRAMTNLLEDFNGCQLNYSMPRVYNSGNMSSQSGTRLMNNSSTNHLYIGMPTLVPIPPKTIIITDQNTTPNMFKRQAYRVMPIAAPIVSSQLQNTKRNEDTTATVAWNQEHWEVTKSVPIMSTQIENVERTTLKLDGRQQFAGMPKPIPTRTQQFQNIVKRDEDTTQTMKTNQGYPRMLQPVPISRKHFEDHLKKREHMTRKLNGNKNCEEIKNSVSTVYRNTPNEGRNKKRAQNNAEATLMISRARNQLEQAIKQDSREETKIGTNKPQTNKNQNGQQTITEHKINLPDHNNSIVRTATSNSTGINSYYGSSRFDPTVDTPSQQIPNNLRSSLNNVTKQGSKATHNKLDIATHYQPFLKYDIDTVHNQDRTSEKLHSVSQSAKDRAHLLRENPLETGIEKYPLGSFPQTTWNNNVQAKRKLDEVDTLVAKKRMCVGNCPQLQTNKLSPSKINTVPQTINLNSAISIIPIAKALQTKVDEQPAILKDLPASFICDHCSRIFQCENKYDQHRAVCNEMIRMCDLCSAGFPRQADLDHHRQSYHRVDSELELAIPVFDLTQSKVTERLASYGIHSYVTAAHGEGQFGIPIVTVDQLGCNIDEFGFTRMFSLGPVKYF